ncbi:MAG: histone deacetylase, partial [Candidatus Dormibacteria bacterium]
DVHHGNGTESIFWEDASVLYTSLHQYPHYPGTGRAGDRGAGVGEGTTLNVPLPEGTDGRRWLEALDAQVMPALGSFGPDLVVISAGYDAHAADPLAGLRLDSETYRSVASRIGNLTGPTGSVWVLEGGYHLDALSASVAATLEGLLHG